MKEFDYKFNEGPIVSADELSEGWLVGNCRRAVQYYIWKQKGIFLTPDKVLCPEAYYKTGNFVIKEGEPFSDSTLQNGDVIYAEKIRDKSGNSIDKSERQFENKDAYIISLHTALFTGVKGAEIWHATAIEGKSCNWPLEKFLEYYKPTAVKRV